VRSELEIPRIYPWGTVNDPFRRIAEVFGVEDRDWTVAGDLVDHVDGVNGGARVGLAAPVRWLVGGRARHLGRSVGKVGSVIGFSASRARSLTALNASTPAVTPPAQSSSTIATSTATIGSLLRLGAGWPYPGGGGP
jgi:hypothetical protein